MHLGLALAAGVACITSFAWAQAPAVEGVPRAPRDTPLTTRALGGGVYVIQGGIPNAGIVVGDKGVIAIDAQMFVETAAQELVEVAKLTPMPVDHVILTHSDIDHVNGLPAFPTTAVVIAQENAKGEMEAAVNDLHPMYGPTPPALKDHLPTVLVRKSKTMTIDGVNVVLMHVAAAHTDSDLIVYLPAQKIVFTGDLLSAPVHAAYPVIHHEKYGSSLGWIKFMKAIVALDAKTYIPGHGQPMTKAMLLQLIEETEKRRTEIKRLFDQGRTLAEINAALTDPAAGFVAAGPKFPSFTETTYEELLRE